MGGITWIAAAAAIGAALGATFELSAARNEEPVGHASEWLAGLSAAWTPDADLQLYVGVARGF